MELQLKRPLVFFDLETTGIDITRDRIVEISMVKIEPNGQKTVKTRRVNPGIPIPAEATAIHHITDEDVAAEPSFAQLARSLAGFIEGCDMAGFNSNRFDVPMLVEEFMRAGVEVNFADRQFIDVQTIYHKLEQRTLEAAYKFYCGAALEGAHGAETDTVATYEVLKAQLDRYPEELKNDVAQLAEYSTHGGRSVDFAGRIVMENGRETFNFGKHKGRAVVDVFRTEPSYYTWMMNGDFPLYTKKVITQIRLKDKL